MHKGGSRKEAGRSLPLSPFTNHEQGQSIDQQTTLGSGDEGDANAAGSSASDLGMDNSIRSRSSLGGGIDDDDTSEPYSPLRHGTQLGELPPARASSSFQLHSYARVSAPRTAAPSTPLTDGNGDEATASLEGSAPSWSPAREQARRSPAPSPSPHSLPSPRGSPSPCGSLHSSLSSSSRGIFVTPAPGQYEGLPQARRMEDEASDELDYPAADEDDTEGQNANDPDLHPFGEDSDSEYDIPPVVTDSGSNRFAVRNNNRGGFVYDNGQGIVVARYPGARLVQEWHDPDLQDSAYDEDMADEDEVSGGSDEPSEDAGMEDDGDPSDTEVEHSNSAGSYHSGNDEMQVDSSDAEYDTRDTSVDGATNPDNMDHDSASEYSDDASSFQPKEEDDNAMDESDG